MHFQTSLTYVNLFLTKSQVVHYIKECDNCKKITTKNLIVLNLDFQTIASHGYDAIAQAIQSYTTINHKKCTQHRGKVELKVNYHSHLD